MKPIAVIKTELLLWLTYRMNHPYAVTEGINHSDVFSINRSGYSHEYEIKTNKADLQKELHYINAALNANPIHGFRENKLEKHYCYFQGKSVLEQVNPVYAQYGINQKYKYFVPNRFFFVIPESLCDYLLSKIGHMVYGVITYKEDLDYWFYETKKKAGLLNKDYVSDEVKTRMLHRATNELVQLRNSLYRKHGHNANKTV